MATGAESSIAAIDRVTGRDLILIAAHGREEAGMVPVPDKVAALVDSVRLLASLGAPDALIGGVAVGIHSRTPRATLNTDLAVASTVERAAVIRAFTAAGFRLTGEFPHTINLRHPGGEPVQLAFDAAFDPMIARCEWFAVGDLPVPIVTRLDLVAMKERAAADPARRKSKRLRDQADVELLRGDVREPDEGW